MQIKREVAIQRQELLLVCLAKSRTQLLTAKVFCSLKVHAQGEKRLREEASQGRLRLQRMVLKRVLERAKLLQLAASLKTWNRFLVTSKKVEALERGRQLALARKVVRSLQTLARQAAATRQQTASRLQVLKIALRN